MIESLFVNYALQFVGQPYRFGSNGPLSWDCSGLALELIRAVGKESPPRRDMTAQELYGWLKKFNKSQITESWAGKFYFYGTNKEAITHIAVTISPQHLIEAGGGNATTKTIYDAERLGWAMVRVRHINHRKDLLEVIDPGWIVK